MKNFKIRLEHDCIIIESLDKLFHLSAGYHDISPFCLDGRYIAFSAVSSKYSISRGLESPAEVYLLDLNENDIIFICNTWAYCWEQGVRLNWLSDSLLSVNYISSRNDSPKTLIYSSETRNIEQIIEGYFLHSFGENTHSVICTSIDYNSIYKLWPSYGFTHKVSSKLTQDNINMWSFASPEICHSININSLESYQKYKKGFLVHPFISPDGSKILFMHRFIEDGILLSWLYLYDLHCREIRLVANEKISHLCWIDSERFIVYQRLIPLIAVKVFRRLLSSIRYLFSNSPASVSHIQSENFHVPRTNSRIAILLKSIISRSSGFCIYSIKKLPSYKLKKNIVALNLLGVDCHPTYSKISDSIVMDSYPDKNGDIHIYSLSLKNPSFAKKIYTEHSPEISNNGKVDAHVRTSQSNGKLCIDIFSNQVRSIKIIKTNP